MPGRSLPFLIIFYRMSYAIEHPAQIWKQECVSAWYGTYQWVKAARWAVPRNNIVI